MRPMTGSTSSCRRRLYTALAATMCCLQLPLLATSSSAASSSEEKVHEREASFLPISSEADSLDSLTRSKRQSSNPLAKAWEEALPGVQPFWEKYSTGPYGVVVRGWQFSRCASEQWTNYVVNVSNIVIWPDYPRFPGPIFFNVTMDVNEELPTDKIEMDLEVRHAVTGKQGSKGWQVIPCQGWNILDGCDGVGSCRYCDMLDKCRDTVKSAHKYVNDRKAEDFLRNNRLCPPPKGHWTMTFSKIFTIDDLPKSFFGPLQSNEYWLTFSFTDGKDRKLGCARLWVDVCKYHLQDKQQKCLRDPNAFKNFINEISHQAEQIRERGK